jgi:hypothetical protein
MPTAELAEEYRLAAAAFREEALSCNALEARAVLEAQAAWWESRYLNLIKQANGRVGRWPHGQETRLRVDARG